MPQHTWLGTRYNPHTTAWHAQWDQNYYFYNSAQADYVVIPTRAYLSKRIILL